jgi:general secretion pathway protein D
LVHAPGSPSSVVGLQNSGNNPAGSGLFTTDLDIPFKQGGFALATPQFGGWDATAATAAGSLGFAIMSDIEAFFFVTALQGDKRSNVLQAPKVTMFNGQQAFVSDTSQTPFVVSVIPVVGDFAAAEQPVIVVLSEGTFMTVQAVVSNDRRFVRLTLVPFFSKIGNVQTFTFTGSDSSTTDTTRNNLINATQALWNQNRDQTTTTHTGVTVQLPTFSYVTVTTTVSVPDGGTVLLGGIKRLSEGRTEYGVPILDKVPYLDRLFKNTGIGRDTSSLMMMVTPRIIIQEEEEEKLGIQSPP